jgi:hypothetical protein
MEKKENLTNEKLGKKFKSQFDLVNYAIRLADNMIRSGRNTRVDHEIENPAMQILEEIETGNDIFEDIIEVKKEDDESYPNRHHHNGESSGSRKGSDRKRNRLA